MSLTDEERANVRAALDHMRHTFGGNEPLAASLACTADEASGSAPTLGLARRIGRVMRVPLTDVLRGRFPPSAAR